MKLFERVIEKRLRKYLKDTMVFLANISEGFGKAKSANDHLVCLSQTVIESFDRGEVVIASFFDVEKTFDSVWDNGPKYKIFQLGLPTKVTRWLSDFLWGEVIQVKVDISYHLKSTRKRAFLEVQY